MSFDIGVSTFGRRSSGTYRNVVMLRSCVTSSSSRVARTASAMTRDSRMSSVIIVR